MRLYLFSFILLFSGCNYLKPKDSPMPPYHDPMTSHIEGVAYSDSDRVDIQHLTPLDIVILKVEGQIINYDSFFVDRLHHFVYFGNITARNLDGTFTQFPIPAVPKGSHYTLDGYSNSTGVTP